MERTVHTRQRTLHWPLAAIGLVAAAALAACGGGDDGEQETPQPTVVLPGDGVAPVVTVPMGTGTDSYPVWAFSLPLVVQGGMIAGGQVQNYGLGVANELTSCTIAMGALIGWEPPSEVPAIEAEIAARSTVGGAFATNADLSVGHNFAFWRLGEDGTENWSSYFSGTDERWSGSGQHAGVVAKFLPWYWIDAEGKLRGFPILAIRVRWSGEAIENLTSRTSSAEVLFECYFAPTGDQLLARGVLDDPNDDGILDDEEVARLRELALINKDNWLYD